MLSPKENMLEVLNWGNPEYVPLNYISSPWLVGVSGMIEEPWSGGKDAFGVNWIATSEGAIPEPNSFRFDDITQWRKYVTIPDPDSFDYKNLAEQELKQINTNTQLINILYSCGLFERLVTFMGFEEGLCALIEEPEACKDFFDEISKFKVAVIERVIDAYHPDIITYADDMAHARGTFMSLETYRELIKPYHKRIADAITSRDVIFAQHICGKAEGMMDDLVEMGCKMWNSAQIMNDLPGVQKKYRGKLVIEGGWDSSGPASYIDADMETVLQECHRCLEEYGRNGGYVCWPILFNANGNSTIGGDPRIEKIIEVWPAISRVLPQN